jgi:micrococcal nuclease
MRLAIIFAVLLSLLTFCPALAQDRLPATVTDIVDGDTIKVRLDDGQVVTVRLTGIDTPETKHPTKPVQCFGAEASAKTAELLPIGATVGLERDVQERDRYGRMLAYVWPENNMLMLNEQLVAEGYALTLTIPPNVRYAENFTNAQRIAPENGLGLWSGCPNGPQEVSDEGPIADDQPAPPPPSSSGPAAKSQAPLVTANCHPSYPDFYIPPPPPDLNCTSPLIAGRKNFTVLPPDPHRFDADKDCVGCEARR